jgi:hypothetical protein
VKDTHSCPALLPPSMVISRLNEARVDFGPAKDF